MTVAEKIEIASLVDAYVRAACDREKADRRCADAYARLDAYLHGLVYGDKAEPVKGSK